MTSPSQEPDPVEIRVEPAAEPQRLDAYLGHHPQLHLTRNKAQKLIESGLVLVNGRTVTKKTTVMPGDTITVSVPPPEPTAIKAEKIKLDIVYQDDYLAVINKPPGMVTHPGAGNYTGTLVNALIYHFRTLSKGSAPDRPGIVHRLDKDTSGLLVVARDDQTYQKLQQAIQNRDVSRTYLALICGHMPKQSGQIDLPVGRSLRDRKKMSVTGVSGRSAVTTFRLLERYRSYDLLEINLQTGRTHQIRVHFSHLGHPVLGDPTYGGRDKWHRGMFGPERPLARKLLETIKRQALHAAKLEFRHPVSGKQISLEAKPPDDFQAAVDILDAEGR